MSRGDRAKSTTEWNVGIDGNDLSYDTPVREVPIRGAEIIGTRDDCISSAERLCGAPGVQFQVKVQFRAEKYVAVLSDTDGGRVVEGDAVAEGHADPTKHAMDNLKRKLAGMTAL